jgi:hypothetical protein
MTTYGLLETNKSGKKEYLKQKFGELSSIQEINSGYIVSSSVAVMSYCLKQITTSSPPPPKATLLLAQIDMLNKICLKSNLDKAAGAGNIDDDLLDNFKEYIKNSTGDFTGTSTYKIREKEFAVDDIVKVKEKGEFKDGIIAKVNTKNKDVGSGKNKRTIQVTDEDNYEVKVGTKTVKKIKKGDIKYVMRVQDLIKQPPKPSNQNELYYINNAVSYSEVPKFFCPFSSIIDGQSTCNSYGSAISEKNKNPIEEGEINIIVRDGNIAAYSTSGTIATTGETMRYHVKVEKGTWESSDNEKKILNISAYLKIKDDVLINIGNVDSYANHSDKDRVSRNKPIEVDLNGKTSPLEAKVCIKEMMETAVELLSNDSTSSTLKKWIDYLKIIDGTTSGQIDTSKTDPIDPDTKISSQMFRRKIIEASFKKSLGDYLQEINTVAENGGYIGDWSQKNSVGFSVLPPATLRLGLSNDRPSGVRAAFLILYGLTGINPNSIAGYMGPSGDYVLAARNKANFAGGGSVEKYKIYNKVNNNTKRRKNLSKKRKILFKKNRKISKRNNKGTKKRK